MFEAMDQMGTNEGGEKEGRMDICHTNISVHLLFKSCPGKGCKFPLSFHKVTHTIPHQMSLPPTLPSRVLRPLSSPFLCLEVEVLFVLWPPSLPLPAPLESDVEDWLTVLFRLGCSAFGVRWRPAMDGEGTGSSFFSKDLFDLMGCKNILLTEFLFRDFMMRIIISGFILTLNARTS